MKLITAIVRPDKLDELIGALVDNQAHGLTVTEVRGFGRQFGQLAAGAGLSRVTLLHKIRLDVVALVTTWKPWSRPSPSMPGRKRSATGRYGSLRSTARCASGPASETAPPYKTISRSAK
jgi:hypothetical protein